MDKLSNRAEEAEWGLKLAQGRAEQAEAAIEVLKQQVAEAGQAQADESKGMANPKQVFEDVDKQRLEQITMHLKQLLKSRAAKQASFTA